MALTRDFKDTVMELCKDPEYRKGLLLEAIESYMDGEIEVGHSLLRDYLNGTQAFAEVADRMQVHEPSLRRMISPTGNPTIKNLFAVFKFCQEREGIHSSDELFGHVA